MGVTLITLRLLEPRGNQVMDKVLAHLCLHTAVSGSGAVQQGKGHKGVQ